MPGCWEIKAAKQVLVGILHVDFTSIAWALGLRNLQIPGHISPVSGMPYDMARNTICQQVLQNGYEFVFFLDSDVIPPPDTIHRLMAHRQPFISGVYHRRSPPHGIPVMLKGGKWITEYPANRLIEVDLVGAGCLLIHRSVLERVPHQRPEAGKTYFDWRVDCKGKLPDGECLSEDFTLCSHVKKYGIQVLVDTSIQCRHIGLAQATYGSMLPCETVA